MFLGDAAPHASHEKPDSLPGMQGISRQDRLACVVLFDIDGTLLTGPGPTPSPSPGMVAMDSSAHLVTGREGLYRRVEFAGRTDRQIACDLLRAGGNESPLDSEVARLIEGYVDALERGVQVRPYRALGGARETVEAFRGAGAVVGLGTGNVAKGAKIKLTSAGLVDLFDLTMGGYGDDGQTRAELLMVGARRCDPAGRLPVVVVGDTPHDVRGGRAIDAICVAVATGPCAKEDLRASNPDVLLDALDEGLVERIEQMLGDGP